MTGRNGNGVALVAILIRQWRLVAGISTTGIVATVALALFLPRWYAANVQLLPSRPSSFSTSGMMALPAELLGIGGGGNAGLLVGILKSRTVTDAVVTEFQLGKAYETKSIEDTRKAFWRHTLVLNDPETGLVTLSFEDRVPTRARDVANAMAEEANRISNELEMNRAGQERRFLEKRLDEVKKDLAAAETAFRDFQTKHHLIELDEQTRATVQAIAALRAELASREIEHGYLSSFSSQDEQNTARVKRQITEIRKQLALLENAPAEPQAKQRDERNILIPVSDLPELGLEYLRRYRELKIQEQIYELLTKQHELAKVGEIRDTASAQIISPAVVPTKRSRPRGLEVVAIGTALTLFLSLGVAWLRGSYRYHAGPGTIWHEIRRAVQR
ncbi:MAG: GNVR domain-containing protein [Pseudomonadota bacterium]